MNIRMIACILLPGLAVSGCGKTEDDPQNVPLLGNWNSKIALTSVDVDGTHYEGDRIPNDLAGPLGGIARYKELGCTEPKVNSVAELNAKLPDQVASMCTLAPTEATDKKIRFESQCDSAKLPAGVMSMSFDGEAETLPDRVNMTFRVHVTAKEEDGQTQTMRIVQNRNFWRVGDCPA